MCSTFELNKMKEKIIKNIEKFFSIIKEAEDDDDDDNDNEEDDFFESCNDAT